MNLTEINFKTLPICESKITAQAAKYFLSYDWKNTGIVMCFAMIKKNSTLRIPNFKLT